MISCLHSVCLLVLNKLGGAELNYYFYYKIKVPNPQGIPSEKTADMVHLSKVTIRTKHIFQSESNTSIWKEPSKANHYLSTRQNLHYLPTPAQSSERGARRRGRSLILAPSPQACSFLIRIWVFFFVSLVITSHISQISHFQGKKNNPEGPSNGL